MRFLITCTPGVESVLRREVERLGGEDIVVRDRSVECAGPDELLARLNLWIRTGNRVYLILDEGRTDTFDALFDLVERVDWKKYIRTGAPIAVDAVSTRSELTNTPTIQKIAKKAIVTSITGDRETFLREDDTIPAVHIFVLIVDGEARILVDTSGDPLHKRGYRTEALDAPIKESLAAALIYLSGWRYRDNFLDPFCGSGTFAIEAAMIARDIAPGLRRHFAFEDFEWYPKHHLTDEKQKAESKIIRDRTYEIRGSDVDPEAVRIAKDNAMRAGVADTAEFMVCDFSQGFSTVLSGTLVTNPPYGIRLRDIDLERLYADIAKVFSTNPALSGGVITSYDFRQHLR